MNSKKLVEELPNSELYELSKIWQKLNLEWKFYSGLTVKVKSHAEWKAYNDIFVDREYDTSIQHALESRVNPDKFTFLDLGANVGFFTIKVADLILQHNNSEIDFRGVLVEGSPSVYSELQQRIDQEPHFSKKLQLIHGLIGEPKGVGKIFESDFHITNSLFSNNLSERKSQVKYIDLNDLCKSDREIDLLKSDIQGSELSFLENYHQHLLKKVRCAIFEIHHDICDAERCLNILGTEFPRQKQLKIKNSHSSRLSLHYFWR